jgi:hypothetical protein
MHPKELLNKTLTAASVAENEGFTGLSHAFQEMAMTIFKMSDLETGAPKGDRVHPSLPIANPKR